MSIQKKERKKIYNNNLNIVTPRNSNVHRIMCVLTPSLRTNKLEH